MKNKEIYDFNQLLAGCLLMFDRVDKFDIKLLSDLLEKEGLEISIELDINKINNNDLNQETRDKETLQQIAGSTISEYCNDMDIDVFILKKIELLGEVPVDSIKAQFCKRGVSSIEGMLKSYHLIPRWSEYIINEDVQVLGITYLGREKIEEFDKRRKLNNKQLKKDK